MRSLTIKEVRNLVDKMPNKILFWPEASLYIGRDVQ